MKNTIGNAIALTLFGESHGEAIGCVLDGLAPGMEVSQEEIARFLSLRRPSGDYSTPRQERDAFRIVSGVYRGKSTGTPLCILIPNENTKSRDYEEMPLRPGHADYTASVKYRSFQDARGGGHFSGRITAPLVAAGAILIRALEKKGIVLGTHIKECAGVKDIPFENTKEALLSLQEKPFPVFGEENGKEMIEKILESRALGDSVGGILETYVLELPAGVGEPWFDALESTISHGIFSIPGVKGLEFGSGFAFAKMKGSDANDPFVIQNGKILTRTNHNGGINGGISNGMPLCFSTCIKPTPTISLPQDTVDLKKGENVTVSFRGRHDPCIVHRAAIVVTSMTALMLADALATHFGTDYFSEENQ